MVVGKRVLSDVFESGRLRKNNFCHVFSRKRARFDPYHARRNNDSWNDLFVLEIIPTENTHVNKVVKVLVIVAAARAVHFIAVPVVRQCAIAPLFHHVIAAVFECRTQVSKEAPCDELVKGLLNGGIHHSVAVEHHPRVLPFASDVRFRAQKEAVELFALPTEAFPLLWGEGWYSFASGQEVHYRDARQKGEYVKQQGVLNHFSPVARVFFCGRVPQVTCTYR